jgi:CBS domain-containing protein
MGEHSMALKSSKECQADYIEHLLLDIEALEFLIANDRFEKGITRIGAEQEFCLVTKDYRPAANSDDLLASLNDVHYTTELAKYNLEINLDPVALKGKCFEQVEHQLQDYLNKADVAAKSIGSRVVLTGILPTISQNHLKLDYITDRPRYKELNDQLMLLRGSNFHLHLMGVDELTMSHDSVLFEACNTSFQLHLQIEPSDFISSFNWAQAIAGPILSICTNSPVLLGRELWCETRIALFRQSIDTRNLSLALKDQLPRVSFGNKWAKGSVVDIYKENIAQFKTILSTQIDENSLLEAKNGKIPKLKALGLYNGTIYPWNRACYGVGGGKPHLRIENRYIPAGPSVLDEMANFALWVGLMKGRPPSFDDMPKVMEFQDAKSNFIKAARYGKEAVLFWEGELLPAKRLLKDKLLPIAYDGLKRMGISHKNIERYFEVIEGRMEGKTGSKWIVSNYRRLQKTQKSDHALRLITRAMYKNQKKGLPVHLWPDVVSEKKLLDFTPWVGHIMSIRLLTVKRNDLADLATSIMQWKNIHHMPVEDDRGNLCGLLTWTHVEKNRVAGKKKTRLVEDIMVKKVITVTSNTPIPDAIALMKENSIGCLPVLQDNELIGIITITDVIPYDHS